MRAVAVAVAFCVTIDETGTELGATAEVLMGGVNPGVDDIRERALTGAVVVSVLGSSWLETRDAS